MTSLEQIVSSAVDALGEPESIDLGPGADDGRSSDPAAVEGWRQRFVDRLAAEAEVHKQALLRLQLAFYALAAFGLLLVAVGMLVLLRVHDDRSVLRVVFGGGSVVGMAGVLAVVRGTLGKIRQLAADKAGFDILLTVIPVLKPAEVVDAVKSLHYGGRERNG